MDPVLFPPAPRGLLTPPAPTAARTAPSGPEEVARVAREFEAVFLGTVVEEMLKTGQPATFGGGHAEEMWRSFLARAFADQISETGGVGIAAGVEASLRAAQDAYGRR